MAVAFVAQATVANPGNTSSFTISCPSSFQSGNCNVVVIAFHNSVNNQVTSVTDGVNAVYTRQLSIASTGLTEVEIWATSATGSKNAGAAQTITVATSTSAKVIGCAAQYSGALRFGNTNTAQGSSANPSIALTLQDAGNMMVAGFSGIGTGAFTAGTGNLRNNAVSSGGGASSNTGGAQVDNNNGGSAGSTTCSVTNADTTWALAAIELRSTAASSINMDWTDSGDNQIFREFPVSFMAEYEDRAILVPQPPLFEWDESQRWQLNRDVRVNWTTTEEDTGLSPIIPTLAWDEVDWQKFVETRQQQDDEPWHTFFTIPILAWDEVEWQNSRDVRFGQTTQEEDTGLVPIIPILAWDEIDWQHWVDARLSQTTQEEDYTSIPIIPILAWDEVDWQKFWGFQYSGPTQEEDTGLVPIIPGLAYDEDQSHSIDIRQQQDDEPWHTFFLIPTPPPNLGWDDWDWNKNVDTRVSQQDDEYWHTFFTIPGLAYDETEGQHRVDFQWTAQEEDTGLLPIIPGLAYEEIDWQHSVDLHWNAQEEDTGLLPIIPGLAYDETDWQKFWGFSYSGPTQEEDTGLLPIIPGLAYDETDWQRFVDTHWSAQEEDTGLLPIIPVLAWDEVDWQKFWGFGYSGPTQEEDTGLIPIIPNFSFDEDLGINRDVRQQQDDEPWHTFFFIPVPPPNLGWDDWDWNKNVDTRFQQDDEPWHTFFANPATSVLFTLYQNVFSLNSGMQSFPVAYASVLLGNTDNVFSLVTAIGTQFRFSSLSDISPTNPSILQASSQLQIFGQSNFFFNFLKPIVRADGWSDLGQINSPGQLLVAPDSGYAFNRSFVVAAGDVAVSSSSPRTLWSIVFEVTNAGFLRGSGLSSQLQFSIGVTLQNGVSPLVRMMQFEFQN